MGDTVYGNKYSGDRVHGDKIVAIHDATDFLERGGRAGRRRRAILLMSANPDRLSRLHLDEERREIDHAVTFAQASDRLAVRTADAVRLDDLQSAMLRHAPVIAHFSGHGSTSAGILVTDEHRQVRPVPPDALSDLFRILADGLECVVLNACFTGEQAQAIAAHVPCVVGMRGRVLDDTAIRFSAGFYQGIAHAQSVRVAFELGCHRLRLHQHTDADVPRLIAAPGAADRPVIYRPRQDLGG